MLFGGLTTPLGGTIKLLWHTEIRVQLVCQATRLDIYHHLSNCGVGGVFGQMMIYDQTNGDTMTWSFGNVASARTAREAKTSVDCPSSRWPPRICWKDWRTSSFLIPIGSMYVIYGNMYHQYTPNVSIYIYIYHTWILWDIEMQTYLSQLTRYCESMWSKPKEEWETERAVPVSRPSGEKSDVPTMKWV